MAHSIHGFIAKRRPLETAATSLPDAVVCALPLEFGFLPLEMPSEADPPAGVSSCERLSAAMNAWAAERSRAFPLAYVQTEYTGGPGVQSAIVWDGGEVVFGPIATGDYVGEDATPRLERAINRALRLLGVSKGREIDEYAALDLGRHRLNDWWRDAEEDNGASYLQMYPKLWKWMNRCLSCGHLGHKPELPEQLGETVAAYNLRRYFPELALNQHGLCEQCAAARNKG